MSGRRFELLVNGEIYHVFNRSVANENIFVKINSLNRALNLLEFYRFPQKLRYSFFKRLQKEEKNQYILEYKKKDPFVEIYTFALMPNHFHLLLKQLVEEGIKRYISNFQNSFGKYFNTINKRAGSIFQKPFKAKHIPNDQKFIHVGRYIHLNPVTSYLVEFPELESYPWTSYPLYLKREDGFVNTSFTLKLVGSPRSYKKFVEDQVDYQRKLHLIKNLILE